MVWKATPEKNSFAIFFSPFGRRGLIITILKFFKEINLKFGKESKIKCD